MSLVWINVFQNKDIGFSRWINMGYLKAAVNKIPNVNCEVNFYKLDEIDHAVHEAVKSNPQIIGLTLLQYNYQEVIDFSIRLKDALPSVHITMGNVFASTYPLYLLKKYLSIDSIVVGEGEFTFADLCTCVINGIPLNNCKGIYYRDELGIHKTDKRKLHDNLDDYEFPDRNLRNEKSSFYSVIGSRGCYGNCTFCDINTIFKGKVRIRSISNILDEIESLTQSWNAKYIQFYDSTFCINRKDAFIRLEEFYLGLIERKLNINFSLSLRAEMIDEKVINILLSLKDLGLDSLFFGFEAGNNEDLDLYGKPSKVQDNLEALRILRNNKILSDDYDISIECGFINYNPYSKFENIKANLEFLRDSGLFVTMKIVNTRFLNYGNGALSKKIEKDGLLLSLPGEPIIDPLAYKFVEPKIQTLYEIGLINEERFNQLDMIYPQDWISVYRRWKKFHPEDADKYTSVFILFIKTQYIISQFIVDMMLDILERVENDCSINDLLKEYDEIISDKVELLRGDCNKFREVYKRLNVDLYKKNELLYRNF